MTKLKRGMRIPPGTLLILAGVLVLGLPLLQQGYALTQQRLISRGVAGTTSPVETKPAAQGAGGRSSVLPGAELGAGGAPAPAPGSTSRLYIPELGVAAVLIEGTGPESLAKGPGIYTQAVRPGEPGNLCVAGHRNAYGSWFRHLDRLQPGDKAFVTVGGVAYLYEVETSYVVYKTDWSPIAPTDYDALTLTTCHPLGSTDNRLIVRARLAGVYARGAARDPRADQGRTSSGW